jgi:hypothetical protein
VTGLYEDLDAALTAEGEFFEIVVEKVRGIDTRCWKAAFPSLGELLRVGHSNGGDG